MVKPVSIKPRINPADLIRKKEVDPTLPDTKPASVSEGGVGPRLVDYVFNATREKEREVTVVSHIEAQLLPQVDVLDTMWQFAIEIAYFRQDAVEYEQLYGQKRPVPPNPIGEWVHRKAQWNKSIAGMNLKSGIDITLAETEARSGEDEGLNKEDPWGE